MFFRFGAPARSVSTSALTARTTSFAAFGEHEFDCSGLSGSGPSHAAYADATLPFASTGTTTPFTSPRAANAVSFVMNPARSVALMP